jgi:diguanylate cyclase (GGDEF)-like protein
MSKFKADNFLSDTVRLEPLGRIPTLLDIQQALDVAIESRVCVRLPWSADKQRKRHFELAVSLSKDPFDVTPRWAFYKGHKDDAKVEWAYATPDLSLIHNMLLCTFSDERLTPEAHNSYAYITSLPEIGPKHSSAGAEGASQGGMEEIPWSAPTQAQASAEPDEVVVDQYQLNMFKQNMLQATTGFYSYAAFQFMLELEFNRYQEFQRPFSLVLISLKRDKQHPVDVQDVIKRMRRIKNIMRSTDLFCHFESSSFGIILTETSVAEAQMVIDRILSELTKNQFGTAECERALWLKIGCATVPDHCESIGALLAHAMHADHSSVIMLR